MRTVGRILAWVVLVVAGLAALLFVAIAIDNDGDGDLIAGGLVLAAVAIAAAVGAYFAQRALRERRAVAGERRRGDATELLERAAGGETVVLRPSRLKAALILLVALPCTLVALAFAAVDPGVLSVAATLLLAAVTVGAAWTLVPGGAYLRISPEGLLVKMPYRSREYAWNDVEDFRVFEISSRYSTQEFVGFDLRHLTPEKQSFWQTINRGMSGVDAGLNDNYGLEAKDLAKALDKLRRRYATERGLSPSARADRELERESAKVDTSRRVVVTWLVGAVCAGVFVWEASRFDLSPTAEQLAEAGGATRGADPWTLLAGNLLHADPGHLLINLFTWAVAGALLEREVGAPRMAVLVLFGGIASMGLAVLLNPGAVTVGLSGVVFAALAWGVLRDVHRLRTLGLVAWSMLPFGVIYTFFSPGTSVGGHLGGLAAGLLIGWSLDRSR